MLRRLQVWMILSLIAVVMPAQAQQAANDKQPAAQSAARGHERSVFEGRNTGSQLHHRGPGRLGHQRVERARSLPCVPVRPDGKISLPLLNDVQAAGLTPSQLAAQITVSLKKYVTSPQVTVIVTTINSQRIYIIGEVTAPWCVSDAARNERAAGAFERGRIYAIRED